MPDSGPVAPGGLRGRPRLPPDAAGAGSAFPAAHDSGSGGASAGTFSTLGPSAAGTTTGGASGSAGAANGTAKAPSDWFDVAFHRRRQLVFDPQLGADATLEDFPVALVLPAGTFAKGSVRNDGADLRFVDATGYVLAFELEGWRADADSVVWLRMPKVPVPTPSPIYMYYDSPEAAAPANPPSVWQPPVTRRAPR